jgi:protein TonB
MNPTTTLDLTAKRHFALPAAIVLSLSAALFFGFGRSRSVMPLPQPHHREIDASEFPMVLSDEVLPEKSDTSPVKGGPARAQLPEVPNPISPERSDTLEVTMPPVPIKVPASTPGSLDHAPEAVVQPAPIYPSEARQDGMHGKVVVEFLVDEAGRVLNPHVVSSSDVIFEEPTLRAVEKWRFAPGTRHGAPVRFRMNVPVTFDLNE